LCYANCDACQHLLSAPITALLSAYELMSAEQTSERCWKGGVGKHHN